MIHINGEWLVDEMERTVLLRGVNLSGSTKVPMQPNGATYHRDGFFNHRDISFVGRPFPLDEADEHFSRLQSWGLTFLRFLVTWEAIEHAGPGIYDEVYLDYVAAVIRKAANYDIQIVIDPHQDVWSRFTGGDGAPGWTLESVGINLEAIHETGSAILHQIHGDPFPRMIWPSNRTKVAAATMFTLFFAGNDFAPRLHIDGVPVQEYLQIHYCNAIAQLASRLHGLPNVIGYDTMNEPLHGYIGLTDLNQFDGIKQGISPTPFQGMTLSAGFPCELEYWTQKLTGAKATGKHLINPKGLRLWREDVVDIWQQHGVWEIGADGAPHLLHPDYFSVSNGRQVDFGQDYLRPFANRFAQTIRAAHPGTLIFFETAVDQPPPIWGEEDARDIIFAPHWYDPLTLFLKHYYRFITIDLTAMKLVIGPHAIRRVFAKQLMLLCQQAHTRLGNVPMLLGETGIPFDLDSARAYTTGNYRAQIAAADRIMRAIEDTLLNCTWWNYTPDNNNQHGDQWNGEDLSIFSRSQQDNPDDIHSGGRALTAIVRPYPKVIAGKPLQIRFSHRSGNFSFTFQHDPQVSAPTEIFVPNYQYPRDYRVEVSDGTFEKLPERQTLVYYHSNQNTRHTIHITRCR
jgi:Glycoside hydrolase family 5 C-terminal domain/Cellulase (glycosyl hydrolase family 5)